MKKTQQLVASHGRLAEEGAGSKLVNLQPRYVPLTGNKMGPGTL